MKRLALLFVCLAAPAFGQNYTTYTGTIKDLTGTTVTSGKITFTLNAPEGASVPGTGSFVAGTVSCKINASGAPVANDGVNPCVVLSNSSMTPTGTSYVICRQPYNITPGSCFSTYANGGSVDISTLVPTPVTQPFYGVPTGFSGVSSDGSSGLSVVGTVSAARVSVTSVNAGQPNKSIYVGGPPYNAQCNTVISSASISIATSGVVTGFTFVSGDAGKSLNAYSPTYGAPYVGHIASVASGVATVTPTPGSTYATANWEYGTDDQSSSTNGGIGTGIQQAFTDADTNGYTVQFPPGICLSSTIVYHGQNFSGYGPSLTTFLTQPGQDGIQAPDGYTFHDRRLISGITIETDSSINKASSVVGGDNTFPNRISGTYGGTTPMPAIYGGPPAPGPLTFTTGVTGNCGASATATQSTVTMSCAFFQNAAEANGANILVGTPITITGAGAAGGLYTGTVTGVNSQTQLAITPAISTTVTTTQATVGTPVTAPFYFGNAGMVIPETTEATVHGLIAWKFKDVVFISNSAVANNYSVGLLITAANYQMMFDNVKFRKNWGGLIEYPPASVTNWGFLTNDTASYKDVTFEFNEIPLVWYAGIHRTVTAMSFYTGNTPMLEGAWIFPTGGGTTASFGQLYDECTTWQSGETHRFGGTFNFGGGAPNQCFGSAYTTFAGNGSTSFAQMQQLRITGNGNYFYHTNLSGGSNATNVTDTGLDNYVEADQTFGPRRGVVNKGLDPVGKPDATWAVSGNITTPFTNGSDLKSTCQEWAFMFAAITNAPGCSSDLVDTGNPFGSYGRLTVTNFPAGWVLGSGGSQGQGPYGKQFLLGDRIPQANMLLAVLGRCDVTCTQTITVKDTTASNLVIGTAAVTFGTSWTVQTVSVNATAANGTSLGDLITISGGTLSGASPTRQDMAVIGFEPLNADLLAGNLSVRNVTSTQITTTSVSGVPSGLAGVASLTGGAGSPTGIPSTTTVYAKVVALDVAGNQTAPSGEASAVTGTCTTLDSCSITWSWTAAAGATRYAVWMSSTGAGNESKFVNVGNVTSWVETQHPNNYPGGTLLTTNQTGAVNVGGVLTVTGPTALNGTSTAPTVSAALNNTQLCTTACVTAAVSSAAGATLVQWASPGVMITGTYSFNSNATRLMDIVFEGSITPATISYETGGTVDNTANLYDLGFYNASGTLLCHIGATAGTSFSPTINSIFTKTLASCPTFSGGTRYYIAGTTSCATSCTVLYGTSLRLHGLNGGTPTSNNTTTGGALNGSIGIPTDSVGANNQAPFIYLHQ